MKQLLHCGKKQHYFCLLKDLKFDIIAWSADIQIFAPWKKINKQLKNQQEDQKEKKWLLRSVKNNNQKNKWHPDQAHFLFLSLSPFLRLPPLSPPFLPIQEQKLLLLKYRYTEYYFYYYYFYFVVLFFLELNNVKATHNKLEWLMLLSYSSNYSGPATTYILFLSIFQQSGQNNHINWCDLHINELLNIWISWLYTKEKNRAAPHTRVISNRNISQKRTKNATQQLGPKFYSSTYLKIHTEESYTVKHPLILKNSNNREKNNGNIY